MKRQNEKGNNNVFASNYNTNNYLNKHPIGVFLLDFIDIVTYLKKSTQVVVMLKISP